MARQHDLKTTYLGNNLVLSTITQSAVGLAALIEPFLFPPSSFLSSTFARLMLIFNNPPFSYLHRRFILLS